MKLKIAELLESLADAEVLRPFQVATVRFVVSSCMPRANGYAVRRVTISGPDVTREVKANRNGYFEIVLPVGKYQTTVRKPGYAEYMLTDLEVGRNQELLHVFQLES
jgi:hypothetical protein